MHNESLAPLLLFALVSTATPGAATTLATSAGANFGLVRSLPMISGFAFGLGLVAATSAAGLGAILAALPALQTAMKVIGTLYLLWLALRTARSAAPKSGNGTQRPIGFLTCVSLLLYNPKAWAMSTSAAASFATLASGPLTLGLLLGGTFCIVAGLSLVTWCVAGQMLARLLKTEKQWIFLNFFLAVALVLSIVLMWL